MKIISLFNKEGQTLTINNLTYQVGQNNISISNLKGYAIAELEYNDGYIDLTIFDIKSIDNSYYTEVETTDDVENAIKKYSNVGDQKMKQFNIIKSEYMLLISEHPQDWGLSKAATKEEIEQMAASLAHEELESTN